MTNKNPVFGADTGLLKDPKNMSTPELLDEADRLLAFFLEIEAEKAKIIAVLRKRGVKV